MRNDDRDTETRRELIRRARLRLREQGRRGLKKNPPRPRMPEQEIRELRALYRVLQKKLKKRVHEQLGEQLDELLAAARGDGLNSASYDAGGAERRSDADDWSRRLRQAMEAVRSSLDQDVEEARREARTIADRMQARIDAEQRRVVRAVLGVEPDFRVTEQLQELVNSWKDQQDAWIRRYVDEPVEELTDTAQRLIRQGRSLNEVRKAIGERHEMTWHRAETIARTEAGHLHAAQTKRRQQELGMNQYVWRTADDERVTGKPGGKYAEAEPSHWAREGKVFSWDDPPEGGHPGERPNCRCRAAPYMGNLIEEIEADE